MWVRVLCLLLLLGTFYKSIAALWSLSNAGMDPPSERPSVSRSKTSPPSLGAHHSTRSVLEDITYRFVSQQNLTNNTPSPASAMTRTMRASRYALSPMFWSALRSPVLSWTRLLLPCPGTDPLYDV